MRNHEKIFLGFIIALTPLGLLAQTSQSLMTCYVEAKTEAYNGRRISALETCRYILSIAPEDAKTKVLMARIYGWNKDYLIAHDLLRQVKNGNELTLVVDLLLTDLFYWEGNYKQLYQHAKSSFDEYSNIEFKYKMALACYMMDEPITAKEELIQLFVLAPNHERGMQLYKKIIKEYWNHSIKLQARYSWINEAKVTEYISFIEVLKRNQKASYIGRINQRVLGLKHGYQCEVDGYFKMAKGINLYTSGGYSSSHLFPKFRGGIELYSSLGKGFNGSLGLRSLLFTSRNVFISTGTIGKYFGNNWVALRAFCTPNESATSYSGELLWRYYFKSKYDWITFRLGTGTSADEQLHLNLFSHSFGLPSYRGQVEIQHLLTTRLMMNASIRYEERHTLREEKNNHTMYSVQAGIRYLFMN